MKISLRKANALQGLINEQINEPFNGSATIGKYDDPKVIVEEAKTKFKNALEKKTELIHALYSIRELVANAGHKTGIGSLLTLLAKLSKEELFCKQLGATPSFLPSPQIIKDALDDIKKDTPNTYQRKDSITLSIVEKETVELFKKDLSLIRKNKQSISDKLLHLNVSTEIELDSITEAVLKKYDII